MRAVHSGAVSAPVAFKRVPVGSVFCLRRGAACFRKCDQKHAFALKETGVGMTHARVLFTRSASVFVIRGPKA